MHKRSSAILRATLLAVIVGIATPGLAAPPEGKGGGKDRGGNPVISVSWSRDIWQAPEIRTMDELGDNMETVTSNPDLKRGGWPRWSPDGLRLGGYHKYIGDAGDYGLMSIAADGTDEQLILLSSELGQFSLNRGLSAEHSDLELAAWSPPGGQSMVFSGRVTYPKELFDPQPAYEVLVWRLFTVSLSDGTVMPVTEVPDAMTVSGTDPTLIQYADWNPHWSWSLNRIVFVSSRSGSQELWAIDPDGTNLQQLTDFKSARLNEPVWSHVGDRIAVRVNLEAPPSSAGDIWVLHVDNGLPVTISSPSIVIVRNDPLMLEGAPAWSPLDDQLVFTRLGSHNSRIRQYEIVIVDLSTDSETVIAGSKKQAVKWPDWNPASPVP